MNIPVKIRNYTFAHHLKRDRNRLQYQPNKERQISIRAGAQKARSFFIYPVDPLIDHMI
jgi:hypothetical protein